MAILLQMFQQIAQRNQQRKKREIRKDMELTYLLLRKFLLQLLNFQKEDILIQK